MPTFRLIVEYDGTDFEGWQRQPGDARTVQGCLSSALERIVGAPVRVIGSGRTDSGVHAEGQVASVRIETRLSPGELCRALNGTLPADVAVLDVALAADDFDARRGALSKTYRYEIWNAATRSPLRARRTLWVRSPLDVDAMQRAAAVFVGTHDFASFRAAGSNVTSTVRTLHRVDVTGASENEISVEFEGSGFLRYMVRNLMGTLLEAGRGRRSVEDVARVLAARDRGEAGPTAPAVGLTLVAVRYDHCGEPASRG